MDCSASSVTRITTMVAWMRALLVAEFNSCLRKKKSRCFVDRFPHSWSGLAEAFIRLTEYICPRWARTSVVDRFRSVSLETYCSMPLVRVDCFGSKSKNLPCCGKGSADKTLPRCVCYCSCQQGSVFRSLSIKTIYKLCSY